MTNAEIDTRLRALADAIPRRAKELGAYTPAIDRELELMNMSLMAIWTMLGEIAKRLPETPTVKPTNAQD